MSITITDPVLIAQLRAAGSVELKDPDGNVIGQFATEVFGQLPPGFEPPFTREEMEERRRKNRTGRPLADIIRDLEARG